MESHHWKPRAAEFGTTDEERALLNAIERGDASGVASALAGGLNPERIGVKGMSPLLFAIPYENLRVIRALVEGGANPNSSPPDLPHPMALAAKEPSGQILKLFLDLGASPDPPAAGVRPYTSTALYADCIDNFHVLIDAGADINANVGPRRSLLGLLINLDRWALAAELLRRGADRDSVVESGRIREKLERKAPELGSPERISFDEVVSLLGLL